MIGNQKVIQVLCLSWSFVSLLNLKKKCDVDAKRITNADANRGAKT